MDNNNVWEDEILDEEVAPKKKVKSIIGLVLGILSLPGALGGFVPVIGVPGWIVSLAMVIVSKILIKNEEDSGLKKGAKVTSTIALIVNIVTFSLYLLIDIALIVAAAVFGPQILANLGM